MSRCLMVQGTASSVGKSVLCSAFLRIMKQDGWKAVPFKAQNMSLNSFVTRDGLEMGRAQVTQAQAAGVEPDVRMNPVLLWGFKAANTLDSMVGYRDEKYRDIGWSSARLDDVLNYLPARLTALLMVGASFLIGLDGKNAWRIVRRDHANHLSPNCAWSEAAAAGALHIQLGGTHDHFGKPVEKPTIGDPDRPAEREDILRSNRLLYVTSALMMILIAAVEVLV